VQIIHKNKGYLKFFITIILFMWLYVKSPFNPLYEGSNQPEMYFIYLNFSYWIIVCLFLIWILFFIRKSNFDEHSTKILTITYGLYLLFYTFYGCDVVDPGFSLSKQWSMYHGLWKDNFDAIAGTNLLGGLWLNIIGRPMLLWARLGFVLVQMSIIYFSHKIILLYFKPKIVFLPFLSLSLFLSIWNYFQTINYDNLPFLFLIVSIYVLLKGLNEETFKKYYFYLSGAIIMLSVFCKITYIVALPLPLFLIILDYSVTQKDKTVIKNRISCFLFGLLIGFSILVGLIFALGGFYSYLSYFGDIIKELISVKDPTKIYSHNHSISGLYASYKDNVMHVLSKVINYTVTILLIEYLRSKTKHFKSMKLATILLGSFILYYFIFEIIYFNQFTDDRFSYFLSFFVSVYVLWMVFSNNLIIKKYLILIVTSAGLFLFAFLGSDLAFRAAFHSSAGLILFTVPIILIKDTEFQLFNVKVKFTFLFYFVIIVFSLNAISKRNNIYRDANFKFLSNSFNSSSLIGIKSTPQRVAVIDSLLTFMRKIPNLNEKQIMFTHSNALMYYLTDTNYILNTPWDILSDYYTLEQDLNSLQPDLFVIPKLSHRIATWPLKSRPDLLESRAKKHYEFYDQFIKENNYVEIYKNSFYTVYSRQDKELTNEQ